MRKVFFLMVFAIVAVAGQGVALGHDCCLPDGSCQAAGAETCAAHGGETFFGLTCGEVVCEPPDQPTPCSPGYWKNHLSVWFDQDWACSGLACDQLDADLNAKGGGGNQARRADAAAFLNAAHLAEFGTLPCTDE